MCQARKLLISREITLPLYCAPLVNPCSCISFLRSHLKISLFSRQWGEWWERRPQSCQKLFLYLPSQPLGRPQQSNSLLVWMGKGWVWFWFFFFFFFLKKNGPWRLSVSQLPVLAGWSPNTQKHPQGCLVIRHPTPPGPAADIFVFSSSIPSAPSFSTTLSTISLLWMIATIFYPPLCLHHQSSGRSFPVPARGLLSDLWHLHWTLQLTTNETKAPFL